MPHEHELEVALEAAGLAGQKIMEQYAAFEAIADAPASITTDADRQAQEVILSRLRRAFPDDALVAEESTATLAEAAHAGARIWIVDPIDGTRGFARKNGEFSVMIGFVENGKVVVGLVYEPARERLTYASRGAGCWRKDGPATAPTRCHVSKTKELSDATLTQSRSKKSAGTVLRMQALCPAKIVETYSAGIKLGLVARGEADIYLNTYLAFHDWDICAGDILVEEAGGKVTGLAGQTLAYGLPGNWQRHGLLATNGILHAATLKTLPTPKADPGAGI
jgi:3'(2'), 5'-bisphosphate nucleotidase